MADLARVIPQPDGTFQLELITDLPAPRTDLLNLTDSVQRLERLTFDELVSRLREAFPVIA